MAFRQQHHRRERCRQVLFWSRLPFIFVSALGGLVVYLVRTRTRRRCGGAWGAFSIRARSHHNCAFVSGDDRCGLGRFCPAFSVGSLELPAASGLGKAASCRSRARSRALHKIFGAFPDSRWRTCCRSRRCGGRPKLQTKRSAGFFDRPSSGKSEWASGIAARACSFAGDLRGGGIRNRRCCTLSPHGSRSITPAGIA